MYIANVHDAASIDAIQTDPAAAQASANEAIADPEVKDKLARLGIEPAAAGTPEQFA
jgi:hypothetical protein